MFPNGVYRSRCQRSGCNNYVYLKSGIKFKIILCEDCRLSRWADDNIKIS